LVARYARTHTPFHAANVTARLGAPEDAVRASLERRAAAGLVVSGAFRPGGTGIEWCDAEVLRMLRQGSLARLRHEVEPVAPAALGRLFLSVQGIVASGVSPRGTRTGRLGVLDAIERIEGAS